uniref:Capsid protein n=1 Tax=Nigrospora oryzae partitivirus 2 TaxID=3231912 RepID=A0AAU8J753_9VIRU
MSADNTSSSEGRTRPGDNPNRLNAKRRSGARPQTKNSSGGSSQSMRLGWIDPLPQVDVIYPLGLEPNVEATPAGEVDLDFALPETIVQPFASVIESVGDRIMLDDTEKLKCDRALRSLSFFKAARQLYSTMQDHEKAANQPLKAVYYDETPIPLHMAGALGIIGHMQTKVGDVLVRDAGILFKRWVARGIQICSPKHYRGDCSALIWLDRESHKCIQRLARERIASLVKQTYTVKTGVIDITVSMPQLVDQDLNVYYNQINDNVPNADDIRHCVAALQSTYQQYRDDDDLPHGVTRQDIIASVGLVSAPRHFEIPALRDGFEDFISQYVTDIKWRIESVFKTGPPPAGSTGYGAQTVTSGATDNTARWQFPLSDADVNIGYLFSPSKGFTLFPKMVGYARRSRDAAAAAFAQQDGKAFTS